MALSYQQLLAYTGTSSKGSQRWKQQRFKDFSIDFYVDKVEKPKEYSKAKHKKEEKIDTTRAIIFIPAESPVLNETGLARQQRDGIYVKWSCRRHQAKTGRATNLTGGLSK